MSRNSATEKYRILFVANEPLYFYLQRAPLVREAVDLGLEVHIATPSGRKLAELEALGATVHIWKLSRTSIGLITNARAFLSIFAIMRNIDPQIVHLITIKSVILGGAAARLLGIRRAVISIAGLGYIFRSAQAKAKLIKALILPIYRWTTTFKRRKFIFQHRYDAEMLLNAGVCNTDETVLVPGSGVDLDRFRPDFRQKNYQTVVFAGRLLREKGVEDFVEAIRILRMRGIDANAILVGDIDDKHPSGVRKAEIDAWSAQGLIDYRGFSEDVPQILQTAGVVVLPSYYGEGIPKILIEAAASGTAAVATDLPGCRDAVVDGSTGFLVPPRDPFAIADKLACLIESPERAAEMGVRARELAEARFDENLVRRIHGKVYAELLQLTDSQETTSK